VSTGLEKARTAEMGRQGNRIRGSGWEKVGGARVYLGKEYLYVILHINYGKFGSIPLKDHHFGSISLLSHLHVGPHESMTCGVHGIYLKFGSFNGIDPIVPLIIH
jgi:hypothetical protein